MFSNYIHRLSFNVLLSAVALSFGLIGCSDRVESNSSTQALVNGKSVDDKEVKTNSVAPQKLTLIRTLNGHTETVNSVAYSPDGKTLASGSYDSTVKIWDLKTMQEIATLNDHEELVGVVAFINDGKTLISKSFTTLSKKGFMKFWNLETNEVVDFNERDAIFMGFDRLAINSNNILATLTSRFHIKLWDLDTGAEIAKFAGHPKETIFSLAFSPDEKVLATGSYDKTIKLWDVDTGTEIKTLKGHYDWVLPIAFSPDGKLIASGSYDNTLRVWDVDTGTEKKELRKDMKAVVTLDFSPDSKTLATGSKDNTVRLWSVHNMQEIAIFKMPEFFKDAEFSKTKKSIARSIRFSPDGKNLAVGSDSSTIFIFKVRDN